MDEEAPEMKGRLMVAEDAIKRLDVDVKELKSKVTSIDICISCLPRIEETQKQVLEELKEIRECRLLEEGAANQKKTLWDNNKDWITKLIFVIAGVVALWVWQVTQMAYGVAK
jgi:hypothetical protein